MTSTRSFLPMRRGKLLVATIGILGLAGCATFSDDGGFGRVEQTTLERLDKDVKWARSDAERTTLQTRVGELLAKPLTADDAIQLALYNNRGLQAALFSQIFRKTSETISSASSCDLINEKANCCRGL